MGLLKRTEQLFELLGRAPAPAAGKDAAAISGDGERPAAAGSGTKGGGESARGAAPRSGNAADPTAEDPAVAPRPPVPGGAAPALEPGAFSLARMSGSRPAARPAGPRAATPASSGAILAPTSTASKAVRVEEIEDEPATPSDGDLAEALSLFDEAPALSPAATPAAPRSGAETVPGMAPVPPRPERSAVRSMSLPRRPPATATPTTPFGASTQASLPVPGGPRARPSSTASAAAKPDGAGVRTDTKPVMSVPSASPIPEAERPADFDLDDDAPILVVEDFPAEGNLFDRAPLPIHARTFYMRYDTAAVGGFVAALLLTVSFMLGRTGGTPVSADVGPKLMVQATQPAAPPAASPAAGSSQPAGGQAPAREFSVSTNMGLDDDETSPPGTAQPPAPGAGGSAAANADAARSAGGSTASSTGAPPASQAPPAKASGSAVPTEAKWGIMAIGGIPQKNASEVAKFLEEKGFKAAVIGSGENYGVIVGAYAEKRGGPIDADLHSVRTLAYKDGKKAFAGAYPCALKGRTRG